MNEKIKAVTAIKTKNHTHTHMILEPDLSVLLTSAAKLQK